MSIASLSVADESVDHVQQLSQKLNAIKTFSSSFDQRLEDANGFEVQVTSGEFKAKQPGYFYWKIDPPYEQVVMSNTELLWLYDPDLEQVTIQPYQMSHSSPASILSGDVSFIAQNYSVTEVQSGKKASYKLDAKPGSPTDFSSIEIRFSGEALSGLKLFDQLGQKTDIQFSKAKTNKRIDDETFEFRPPPGVDVLSSVEPSLNSESGS